MTEPKLSKDRECPFCRQPFTASSLGRHLDQFIRDNKPKPSDDVHDVEEIKKLRASITRRQPRQSLRRFTPVSGDVSPAPSTSGDKPTDENETFKTYFNRPGWEATGVISDVASPLRTIPPPREPSASSNIKEQVNQRKERVDLIDHARASELALQEVLENLRVAKQRACADPPFDFNFFSLSLPQMYLRCLRPPPNLLSGPPLRPSELVWSVDPPSKAQCETLRAWLTGKLSDWKRRNENHLYSSSWAVGEIDGGGNNALEQNECLKREEPAYYDHLERVFKAWQNLPDLERKSSWHLECARALALEFESHQETKEKLEQAKQEAEVLRHRLDQMALRTEDERLLSHSSVLPFSRQMVASLAESDELDQYKLISKWKGRLQSARSAQRPLPITIMPSTLNGRHANAGFQNGGGPADGSCSRGHIVERNGALGDGGLEDAHGDIDADHPQYQSDTRTHVANGDGIKGGLQNIISDRQKSHEDMSMELG